MQKVTLDPEFLQTRAHQCRQIAVTVKDEAVRARLCSLASEYELLASQVEEPDKGCLPLPRKP
jgi:hypothetical protein